MIIFAFLAASLGCAESADSLPAPLPDPRIVVFKGERVMLLYSGETILRRHAIGLGFEPVADKQRQGDGATPEGEYRICVKNPNSRFYLSLGLDYPNRADAERGLHTGLISQSEHDAILGAVDGGRCPPWNTDLGGEIFIHGRGSGSDWTLGCVALDDPAMKELFDAVPIGTPVIIRP